MNTFPLLTLLCFFLLNHSSFGAAFFQPAANFSNIQIWGNWYEQAFVDSPHLKIGEPCPIYSFTQGCGADYYQLGFANTTIDGPLFINTETITATNESGVFTVTTNFSSTGTLTVLDFDPLYEWVIFGDTVTVGVFITALSKTITRNEALLNRTIEVAGMYNFTVHANNYNKHSSACNYTGILLEQQAARNVLNNRS